MIRSGNGGMVDVLPSRLGFAASQDEERCVLQVSNLPRPEEARYVPSRRTQSVFAALFFTFTLTSSAAAHPHSPLGDRSKSNRDYFIQLGEAVHGGFGPLIALGIRLGDDALKTLGVGPRTVDVTYYQGKDSPCPCAADGIMLVAAASPGQGTLRVVSESLEAGIHGRVVIRHKRSGRALEYVIPASINAMVEEARKGNPDKRWTLMMDAPEATLFTKRMIEKTQ